MNHAKNHAKKKRTFEELFREGREPRPVEPHIYTVQEEDSPRTKAIVKEKAKERKKAKRGGSSMRGAAPWHSLRRASPAIPVVPSTFSTRSEGSSRNFAGSSMMTGAGA